MKRKAIVAILLLGILLLSSAACGGGEAGKIAFVSNRDGNREVYIMDADGSNQTNLTNSPAHDDRPTWSPDGTKIAFYSDRDGQSEIYVMNADGSKQTNLTNNPAADSSLEWSPDGAKIAFVSDRDGNDEIYVMDADGSNPIRLTDAPASERNPTWSPDGIRIAFAHTEGPYIHQVIDLWVMDADGSNQVQLTSSDPCSACGISDLSWSPDGERIVFASGRYDNRLLYDIYVMDAGGSDPTRIPRGAGYGCIEGGAVWSPDGKKIAFVRFPYAVHDHGVHDSGNDIWVMDADGSDLTQLTDDPASEYSPSWSPDGTKIAFDFERARKISENYWEMGGKAEIYVMDADGSDLTQLTDNDCQDEGPAWRPQVSE